MTFESSRTPPPEEQRGRLTIYLGYAAGVGKTYRMLEEAQRLRREGRDVVVGYFESHGRRDTIARIEGLEVIPRRRVAYRDREFEEMDTEAILARRPAVCAVDEFPHTNVPGSARAKRWEDVMVLLGAGIDVMTTMNIQHLESLNDQVREIAGIGVRETIPDWLLKEAHEVVMIDIPPQALRNRLERGVVYAPDKARLAMDNFFKETTLAALRELALRQTAHAVDVRQTADEPATGPRERLLLHVTAAPATAALIRRGRRVADYLKADCFAVAAGERLEGEAAEALERHLDFARKLRIETRVLESARPAEALVEFARRHEVTQIFLVTPDRHGWAGRRQRRFVFDVIERAKDMQVTVVAERRGTPVVSF